MTAMSNSALALETVSEFSLLVVEDNPADAFTIESLLDLVCRAEYRVKHVKSQREAMFALKEHEFDACLLDLSLPDAMGFSALVGIQEKAPGMPVLILTGLKDTETAKNAVRRGAQDYLLKDELKLDVLERAIEYAIERKRMEKNLFVRANCDQLTGLANREFFLSRLQLALARSQRTGTGVAVLFIDLDRFKPINDTYGHDAGDKVLKTTAVRLKKSLRAYDTAARLGGDEFAVLLEGMAHPRDAAAVVRKLVALLTMPVHYNNHRLSVDVSIGIAFTEENIAAEELLHHADTAMYQAKREGNCFLFYSCDMQEETAARLRLEDDIRTALDAEEFLLHFQPYVTPDGEAILGVEALLRWRNPEHGMVQAHEFLAAAESARLMPEISAWMGRQLLHDIALWNAEELPALEIAINLSVSQLDDTGLEKWLLPLVEEDFLGAHRLAAEISEEALASLTEKRFLTLARLHENGIRLHLDHFGCGALPLQALHTLPFSLLKLDASLIKSMSAEVKENTLISAAILLAHHMGMKAGAVGVETPWQMRRLAEQSCDAVQGYITAQPMTAQELVSWVKQDKPRTTAGQDR